MIKILERDALNLCPLSHISFEEVLNSLVIFLNAPQLAIYILKFLSEYFAELIFALGFVKIGSYVSFLTLLYLFYIPYIYIIHYDMIRP